MPAVVVGDVFQVTFNGKIFGQRIMLTHYYSVFTNDNGRNEIEAADLIMAAVKAGGSDDIETPYCEALAVGYTCDEIWCQKVWPDRYRRRQIAATEVGSAAATEVCNLHAGVTLFTAFSGRDQQATKHIGPIASDTVHVSDGLLTVDGKALITAVAIALTEDLALDASGFLLDPCIFHGFGAVPRFNNVEGYVVHDEVRSSGRRVVGRGI